MKHIKSHPINDKYQRLSKLKKEDHRSAKEKKMSAEKDLAEKPKVGKSKPNPSNKKLDGEKFLSESVSLLTDSEKKWLENMIGYADDRIAFEKDDIEIKQSIFSKLGIGENEDNNWEIGNGY